MPLHVQRHIQAAHHALGTHTTTQGSTAKPRLPSVQVCIAPEGTCGDGRGLLEFRTGAFVLGRPVLPVCLKYGQGDHNPAWGQVRVVCTVYVWCMRLCVISCGVCVSRWGK